MAGMNRPTRMRMIVVLGGVLLCAALALLIRAAYISEGWTQNDTIAVTVGAIVALAQVLLVYAWIEPSLKSFRERQSGEDWKEAVREFLAFCSMSARDLSFNLAYHIEETDRCDGVIALRHGIVETLEDISCRSMAFDTMARLCSSAFSDAELAKISEISDRLRSCAENASSACNRLKLLESHIPAVAGLDETGARENTYHRRRMPGDAQGVERQLYWLVRDIDEIFTPMMEVCTSLWEFALKPRYDESDMTLFIESSLRYKRAMEKLQLRRMEAGVAGEPDHRQNERVSSHRRLMKESMAKLKTHRDKIDAQGICIAWLPDFPPDPQ